MANSIGFLLLLTIYLFSCSSENQSNEKSNEQKWSKEHSVDYNEEVHIREELSIKSFLQHFSFLKMKMTNSGLRYVKYIVTDLEKPEYGDNLKFAIDIKLLDQSMDEPSCYKTDINEGYEEIILGKSEIESGIQEALSMMRKGECLKCILPSYLGHGLIGDRYTIPPQAILYIDIKLVDIN